MTIGSHHFTPERHEIHVTAYQFYLLGQSHSDYFLHYAIRPYTGKDTFNIYMIL